MLLEALTTTKISQESRKVDVAKREIAFRFFLLRLLITLHAYFRRCFCKSRSFSERKEVQQSILNSKNVLRETGLPAAHISLKRSGSLKKRDLLKILKSHCLIYFFCITNQRIAY